MIRFVAVLSLLGTISASAGPKDSAGIPEPKWPPSWSAEFVSEWKRTTGTYSVLFEGDFAAEKIVLVDGSRDHLCASFQDNTSCVQLTTEGFRFLFWPEIEKCCKCCTYNVGKGKYPCGGPLGPQWLSSKTDYFGIEMVRGHPCHKWKIDGVVPNHSNFYFQFPDGLPCAIDGYNYLRDPSERADDQYIFDRQSFNFTSDRNRFAIPQVCHKSTYCGGPVCAYGLQLQYGSLT